MNINFNRSQKTNYSSLFSGMSGGMSNFLADYASLKNGSYGKLMTAYYKKNPTGSTSENYAKKAEEKAAKPSTSSIYGAREASEQLSKVNSAAEALKGSASKLLDTGSNSLFVEKNITTKDKNGVTTTTYGYDEKAIYNAVSSFVDEYNNMLDQGSRTTAASVSGKMSFMNSMSQLSKDKLAEIGISVSKTGRLSMDGKKFKEADISAVKSLFNESGSYASQIHAQAKLTGVAAVKEAEKVGKILSSASSGSSSSASSSSSLSTSKDTSKTLSEIQKSAGDLKKAVDALLATGSKSLFNKENVTIKDENGFYSTGYDYDKEKIYKAVSSFVGEYNDMIADGKKSSSNNVTDKVKSLKDITGSAKDKLAEIGLTVGSDGTLSLSKKDFMKSDMESVKSLFHKVNSYGDNVSSQAFWIHQAATREAGKSNTYNASGGYNNNYSAGNIFGSLF